MWQWGKRKETHNSQPFFRIYFQKRLDILKLILTVFKAVSIPNEYLLPGYTSDVGTMVEGAQHQQQQQQQQQQQELQEDALQDADPAPSTSSSSSVQSGDALMDTNGLIISLTHSPYSMDLSHSSNSSPVESASEDDQQM